MMFTNVIEIDGRTYQTTTPWQTERGWDIAIALLDDGSRRTVSRRPGGTWAWGYQ